MKESEGLALQDQDQPGQMTQRTRYGLAALGAALVLGLLGDGLLRAPALGINGFLWVGALATAILLFARRLGRTGEGRWMLLPAVAFAAGWAWRDSPTLAALDLMAVTVSLGLTLLYLRGGDLRRAGIVEYGLGIISTGIRALAGLPQLVAVDIAWPRLQGGQTSRRATAIGRGLLIAVPLLLLFGSLFAAADPVFGELVGAAFVPDLSSLISHVLLTGVCSWAAAGLIRPAIPDEGPGSLQLKLPRIAMGATEMGIVLGLLNLLFLAFVLVQFRYFFGGAAHVEATTGLTYAEYARRGFFELVWVSILVLPVLLLGHWLLPSEKPAQERSFRWLAGSLVGLLFVIMLSAVQRMLLYQKEFGLTELRLYTTAFMAWLFLLFVAFLLTVLRGRRERFVFAALVTGFAVLGALHVINPDALIIRTNVARAAAATDARPFDADYAGLLSADGVPALIEALPLMEPQERALVAESLQKMWGGPDQAGWRSWNWGRIQARRAVGR
jgi:hypothetical protein